MHSLANAASMVNVGSSSGGGMTINMPCPTHSGKNTLPHQHQHHQHLHGHHHHRLHSSSTNQSSNDGNSHHDTSNKGPNANKMDEQQQQHQHQQHEKYATLKKDDSQSSRSYSDVRKSAPDVVIISGCTSSH